MNTYEFEYDTFEGYDCKISYNANTLVEAIRKLKRNTHAYEVHTIKENNIDLVNSMLS